MTMENDLVERLREEADYLDTKLLTFTGPLSVITALRDAAAHIQALEAELARKTEALKWVLTKIETGRDRSGSGYYDVAFHDNDLRAARSTLEEKTDV